MNWVIYHLPDECPVTICMYQVTFSIVVSVVTDEVSLPWFLGITLINWHNMMFTLVNFPSLCHNDWPFY